MFLVTYLIPAQRSILKSLVVFMSANVMSGKKSLVIFGLGYGLQPLQRVAWLQQKSIYYWGDIDTHGFAMLDQIRHYLPQTRSMLMDRQTLLQHRSFWGSEKQPVERKLDRLNAEEQALYRELLNQSHATHLRLEQERIRFPLLLQALEDCGAADGLQSVQ